MTTNLINYNMEQLKEIARTREIKGFSKLRKQELVEKITESVLDEDYAYKFFIRLDEKEFDIFKQSLDKTYIIDSDVLLYPLLEEYGYVYITDEGEVLLEESVKNMFKKIETDEFKKERERYQLIDNYLDAAINLYGIFSVEKILGIINEQNDINVDENELEKVLSSTFLDIEYKDGYIFEEIMDFTESHRQGALNNLRKLFKVQGDKPYYVPEKSEFLKYKDLSYFEKNEEYNNVYNYFYKKTNENEMLVNTVCNEVYINCKYGLNMEELFRKITSMGVIFNNEKELQECVDLIVKLSNNTRIAENRGYTPTEIARMHSPQIFNKKEKVGRNDLCICGSGKKYKKCCGRN